MFRSTKHARACAKYRKEFIEKNSYLYCEYCGTSNSPRFETHHIYFASEKPNHPELHNCLNLCLICLKCHNNFHAHKYLRDKLIKERNLNDLFK